MTSLMVTALKLDPIDILKDLEEEVEATRKAHEDAKVALEVLRRKYGVAATVSERKGTASGPTLPLDESGHIDLDALQVDSPRPPLSDTVKEVISRFGGKEFTVGHVYAILVQMGEVPNVKSPKASIAQALTGLEKRGGVIRTFKGSGNTPHKFQERSAFTSRAFAPDEGNESGSPGEGSLGSTSVAEAHK